MTQREKRLVPVAVAVTGAAILIWGVYPAIIKPWFDMDDQIARLEDDLVEQEEKRDRIDDALLTYKQLVERTGDIDPMKVRNHLQGDLEELIRMQQLQETRVTPKRPTTDRKTGLHTVSLSIAAEGRLERIVRFMGKCYELPYITRFKDIKLAPATGKTKDKKADRVRVSATLEVLVLPKHPRVRDLIDLDALRQPAKRVKHAGEPLAMIWERKPFNEYFKPTIRRPDPSTPPRPEDDDGEKKPVVAEVDPGPKTPLGDPDRKDKYVAGVLRYGQDELLIIDKRRKTNQYVATGEKLDGGDLLYVHPYGGVVRKEDGDYFYEIGLTLDQAVLLKDGMDLSEVNRLVMRLPAPSADLPVDEVGTNETTARPDRAGKTTARPDRATRAKPVKAGPPVRPAARKSRKTKGQAHRYPELEGLDASERHKVTKAFRGRPRGPRSRKKPK